MIIHREGFKIIRLILLVIVILDIAVFLLAGKTIVFIVALLLSVVFIGLVLWFFRDPQIEKSARHNEVLSVADGRVVSIEPVIETEYFSGKRIQVSVFMSLFNVHINHVPIAGEIVYQKHHDGKFKPANLAKSSGKNERCTTVIRTEDGMEILIRQIAGIFARRIVTYKGPGEKVTWEDQLGFIRFGSRVDLFLPLDAKIAVRMNQMVTGGITLMANI
jgi:phosphatidylserine decarboxylase